MHFDKSGRSWSAGGALLFAFSVCAVYWALCIVGSFGPGLTITTTVRDLQLTVDTRSILVTGASLVPGLYCFLIYPESRSSLAKANANWRLYFIAIATGMSLPFLSYAGTRHSGFPWGEQAAVHLAKVFAINLFLSPLWEEIVWRGCFLKKIRPLSSATTGIVLMSIGWTVWHGGYLAFLYSGGVPIRVLCILPLTYFGIGIVLGSVFEIAHGSLWPCVLLHAAFNAAQVVYYSEYDRVSELGSYFSELIFTIIAAALFLWVVTRRNRVAVKVSAQVGLQRLL